MKRLLLRSGAQVEPLAVAARGGTLNAISERIAPRQFHEADGVEDWRVVGEGACAYFRTGSFAAGVALVDAIGGLAEPRTTTPTSTCGTTA